MKTSFSVTLADIAAATPCNTSKCMVAKCLQRTLGRSDIHCTITTDYDAYAKFNAISIYEGDKVELPREVYIQMCRFDNGELIAPFSFELEVPLLK